MLLLTGATGSIGSRLLPLLLERGEDVRCLVREPRRLGARRVDVQIALGDLGEMSDPYLVRQALRGVDTVVHLAATIRDQPPHRIEELNGLATVRLLRAAERSGVERFHFFSALNATAAQRTRFFRAKWLAEQAVASSPLETTVFAPSIVYDHSDPWVTLLRRFSFLPVLPVSGRAGPRFQPIWAGGRGPLRGSARSTARTTDAAGRYELAGPETLTYDQMSDLVSRVAGRPRPLVHLPLPLVRSGLIALRSIFGEAVFATWEEAELMEVSMTSERGTADVAGARSRAAKDGRCPGGAPRGSRRSLDRASSLALVAAPARRDDAGAAEAATSSSASATAARPPSSTNSPSLIGKHPALLQTFHPWGNSLNAAYERWRETGTRPILHISTADDQTLAELITPKQIALGGGDNYLLQLNDFFAKQRAAGLHPPAGRAEPLPQRLVGGQLRRQPAGRRTHDRLVQAGLPPDRDDRPRRPDPGRDQRDPGRNRRCRRSTGPRGPTPTALPAAPVSIIWSPLPGGSPRVKGNFPGNYWPGSRWVDWVGTDFYSPYPVWRDLNRFYAQAAGRRKPFAITEWAVSGDDEPRFMRQMFAWMVKRPRVRMLVYYRGFGEAGNPYRLGLYPRSARLLRHKLNQRRFPQYAPFYPARPGEPPPVVAGTPNRVV